MDDCYRNDKAYFRAVRLLREARDLDEIKTVLGDVLRVWPDSVRRDLKESDKLAAHAKARLARQAA